MSGQANNSDMCHKTCDFIMAAIFDRAYKKTNQQTNRLALRKTNKTAILFACLMAQGVSLGVLWYLLFWTSQLQESSLYSIYTLFQVRNYRYSPKNLILELGIRRVVENLSLLLLCTTIFGKIALILNPIVHGLSMGSVLSILIGRFAGKGIFLFILLCLPQWVFYWLNYYECFLFGVQIVNDRKAVLRNKENLILVLLRIFAWVILGCFCEALLGQRLLTFVLRYL